MTHIFKHINLHNLKHTKESHSCAFAFVTPIVLDPATGGTTTDEEGSDGAGEDKDRSRSINLCCMPANTYTHSGVRMCTTSVYDRNAIEIGPLLYCTEICSLKLI